MSWEESMEDLEYRQPHQKEEDSVAHCAKSDFKYYIYYVSGHYYEDKNNATYNENIVSKAI